MSLNQVTKIFNGQPLRLDLVGSNSSRRIVTFSALNNTPYYLYVGLDQQPTRESALFVVNPYTDVTMPLNIAQALYVLEGPSVGSVPSNSQAVILWGEDVYPMSQRAVGRTVVIPVFAQSAAGSTSNNFSAQNVVATPTPFAIPASARRRTLYGVSKAGFASGTLQGSIDGLTWFDVTALITTAGATSFCLPLADGLALPPYMRITADGGPGAQMYMVVDL